MGNDVSPLVPIATTRLIKTFQVARLIRDWQATFDIDISSELSSIEEIFLYHCEVSQLDFFRPVSAAGSDDLYRNLQKFDWFYMPEKWEFEESVKDLVGCKKILEVGCGPGHFVEKATKKLKGAIVKGIELNELSLQRALLKNLPVESVDLAELVARGEIFDGVCGFQVLEHISEPYEFLETTIKLLSPGGRLILSVPNKDSFLKYQYKLLDMPPHHMTRWNAFTFKYLEELFPLKVVRMCFEPLAQYHISEYLAAYGQYCWSKVPVVRRCLSERRLRNATGLLEKSGLYRLLRGQSLYAVFERL